MASRIQIVTGRHNRLSVVKIVTKEFDAAVKRSTSEVILTSGVHCKVKERMCFDFDKMETYWRNLPTTHYDQYDVLYEETANKLSSKLNLTSGLHSNYEGHEGRCSLS